jgi:hypothetical protein
MFFFQKDISKDKKNSVGFEGGGVHVGYLGPWPTIVVPVRGMA